MLELGRNPKTCTREWSHPFKGPLEPGNHLGITSLFSLMELLLLQLLGSSLVLEFNSWWDKWSFPMKYKEYCSRAHNWILPCRKESHFSGCGRCLGMVSICIFLIANNTEHFRICLIDHFCIFFFRTTHSFMVKNVSLIFAS